MVKGISRQVIVVPNPDPKLFEQAIFILKDEVVEKGVTEEVLLKEAEQVIGRSGRPSKVVRGPFWACAGAMATGLLWLLSALL